MLGKSKKAIVLQSSPYLAWSILFIIVPLFMVLYYGLTDADGNFTLDNIAAIAQPEQARAFGLSLVLALAATAICFLLAYPLAMILARRRTGERGLVTTLFLLPMWMNFLLRTFAWMTILEDGGVLNGILSALGLPTAHIINTSGAIIIGMVYNFLPFMILPLYHSLASIDMNVINAARDLGATTVQTFFRVTLPLTVPGILSGITMVFIPALTTFAISTLLGGSKILLIGNIIEQEFTLTYDWNLGSGLSLVLMVFVIINIVVSGISEHREEAHK
ncbi:MAG: ABC transporter permease [Lachnospiraceae bacterium]|nr:ABC transporter permease [Lachnospiraceae bacterium]